jgi:hypothetical protein
MLGFRQDSPSGVTESLVASKQAHGSLPFPLARLTDESASLI